MPDSSPLSIANIRFVGFYLPTVLCGYVYLETQSFVPLILATLSVIFAVGFHGTLRSIFGPGGPEENPLLEPTTLQRFIVLIMDAGPTHRIPENLLDVILNGQAYVRHASLKRWLAFLGLFGLFPVWIVSGIYSLVYTFPYLGTSNITLLILYSGLVFWSLQFLWRYFTPVYYLEEELESYAPKESKDNHIRPERPTTWMKPDDAELLDIIHSKHFPVTSLLVTYHFYDRKVDKTSPREMLQTVLIDGSLNEHIEDRLQTFADYNIVHAHDDGLYSLTSLGQEYVNGQISAEILEY